MDVQQPRQRLSETLLFVLATAAIALATVEISRTKKPELEDGAGRQLGRMVAQVASKYLKDCHLLTFASGPTLLLPFVKELFDKSHASVVVEANSFLAMERMSRQDILKGLWPDSKDTCRGIILDVTMVPAYSLLDILESIDLWLQPNTVVVFVGRMGEEEAALYHETLRNTHHSLYLAVDDDTLRYLKSPRCYLPVCKSVPDWQKSAKSYWRCFYCNKGNQAIKTYGDWSLEHGLPQKVKLFQDQTRDFMGHTFTVVGLSFFPIMDYIPDSNLPGTTITLTDCLDKRILTAVASALNFNYITREPSDGEWGLDQDGNWTGIVGDLQHNKADFSLLLGLVYSRAQVMDYSSIYINDRWVIISLRLQPLTQYLALIKPFTAVVWIGILVSILIVGVILWLFTRAWTWISEEYGPSISSSLLFTWGVLLSSPALNLPVTLTIRMLVLWLGIFSVIVTSAYRSSLIAHLTVRIFPPPINSFQDLVESDGVSWGSEPLYGTEVLFFNSSLDPVIREFYSKLEFDNLDYHMDKVMKGRHAFFNSRTYMRHVIASQYTNSLGFTPLHFSQTQYPTSAGSVWGTRRGAIFTEALTRMRTRLDEMGLFDYWMNDVIATKARQIRKEIKEKEGQLKFDAAGFSGEDTRSEEILSLSHLQGCFYILFIGYIIALFTLTLENCIGYFNKN
ncbi:glutamate receptor-like [Palaemon carinicauda]|uniref:glutamate receptor-like n=1 Tax=Palaemon carinicauda TaxID=392227 RepID=UPI0035B5C6B8